MLTSGSSEVTAIVDAGDGWLPTQGAVFDDLLVWSELDANAAGSRIRALNRAGDDPETLFDLPLDTCRLHVTKSTVGGVMGYGQGCTDGQAEARFWAYRRGSPPGSPPSESAVLYPEAIHSAHSSMSGDFIASTFGTWTQKYGFIIARISDWRLRALPIPDGYGPVYFTLANEMLYLAYTPLNKDKGTITEILRYDLGQFFETLGVPYEGELKPLSD